MRTWLITGCSTGFGKSLAKAYYSEALAEAAEYEKYSVLTDE